LPQVERPHSSSQQYHPHTQQSNLAKPLQQKGQLKQASHIKERTYFQEHVFLIMYSQPIAI